MKLLESAAPPVVSDRLDNPNHGVAADIARFGLCVFTVADMEVRKLRHDPTELVTRAVQPVLWLVIFGEVFSQLRSIPTGGLPYLDFMTPGILAQGVMFISIFYGISIIWERDLGILHKLLATPAARSALVLGKALSAGVRGMAQAVAIYVLAALLGVHLNVSFQAIVGVIVLIILGSGFFSTFSLIIACIVKTRERFMGIGQVLTMPLFFASNAIYPIAMMPGWLQAVSHVNPLTYEIDGLRGLMLTGGSANLGLGMDLAILTGASVIALLIAARLYPGLAT